MDIGGGINPFGESIDAIKKAEESLASMTKKFEPLVKSLKAFEPVTKEMNKSKFSKATKSLNNAFKSMIGAAASGDKIGVLMAALKPLIAIFEPLGNLLKPFSLILELLSVLISAMVGAALVPMYDALEPIYDAIIDLIPTFIELGTLIGGFIANVLVLLIDVFILLLPPFIQFMTRLMESEGFMILVAMAIGFLVGMLGPLITIIGVVTMLIVGLVTVFTIIGNIINDVVMPAISILANIINDKVIPVLGILAQGFVGFINTLIGIINSIMNTLTVDTWADIPNISVPGMEEGGIALSHGLYELGEGGKPEMVVPLDEWRKGQSEQIALLGLVHDELVTQSYYNRKIVRLKEWKIVFE